MSRRAVLLAGGKGSRLRPYTVVLPKPLMPLGEYPVVEVLIRQLAFYGFDHITLAVNHQAEIIRAFFGNGEKWGVRVDYSLEPEPLSTIGPLRLIPDLPEDFLLLNGDILTDLDFRAFFSTHLAGDSDFTIAAHRRVHRIDYGVLHVDSESRLSGFEEKPTASYLVSMGVYAVRRRILEFVPAGRPYGFDHLMLDLLKKGRPVRVEPHDGLWLDIGRPDDYVLAIDTFEEHRHRLLP